MNKLPWAKCPIPSLELAHHCWAVSQAHEKDSDQAEYGVNWYEWININDHIVHRLVGEWWDTLTAEEQHKFLADKRNQLQAEFVYLTDALCEMYNGDQE